MAAEQTDPETYSTHDAARILAVSERRVRQLVEEGKLPGNRDKAGSLRIPCTAVDEERGRRRETGRKRTASFPRVDLDFFGTLAEIVSSATASAVERALEGRSPMYQDIVRELAEQRLRVQQLEAEVASLHSPQPDPPVSPAGITPARSGRRADMSRETIS